MINTIKNEYIIRLFDVPSMAKRFLIIFLLLLPFQNLLKALIVQTKSQNILLKAISYSDEISTLLMFGILFSFIAFKPKAYTFRIIDTPMTKPLFLFILVASMSILWNRVYIFQGIFGIYDVIKNILVFYVFATLRWNRKELFTFIFWIEIVVIILVVTGLIAEILSVAGMTPKIITNLVAEDKIRLGFHRVASLTGEGAINYLGMYTLLGLFLIHATVKSKIIKFSGIAICLGLIFFTFSRQTWIGLSFMLALTNRRLILPGIMIFGFLILVSQPSLERFSPDLYFRAFAYLEALDIFINNPIIGAGPGMFGGLASVMFHSPYYSDWPSFYQEMVYSMGSIDSYWPVILAEVGILGFLAYFSAWIALHNKIAAISRWFKSNDDMDLYRIGNVLKNYIIALIIMCFFTGLNKPFVIYTFFALCGIYMSLYYQYKEEDKLQGIHNMTLK